MNLTFLTGIVTPLIVHQTLTVHMDNTRYDCNGYCSWLTRSVALATFTVTNEYLVSRLSIICAIPTLIVHHVILVKNGTN